MSRFLLRLGVALTVALATLLSLEGAASLWIRWAKSGEPPPVREITHAEYDSELGWIHRPNFHVPDQYGPGVALTTNGQRLRGLRDHALEDSDESYRVLCLGDSFTMGYGVADELSYPALLDAADPRIEAINMGMGGYGIDQCYLWYLREGVRFDVDVLLFTFIMGDFYRMDPQGNVANRGKPLMELVDGEPLAINLPVPNVLEPTVGLRLGNVWRKSALRELFPAPPAASKPRVPIGEERFAPVALRIFEKLRDLSAERGQRFVLGVLPTLGGRKKLAAVDTWLAPALEERGIPLIDLRAPFATIDQTELDDYFVMGHYSERGNRLAAQELLKGLRALDPACPR